MGRNLQLFTEARKRIEAELARKGVPLSAERGAYRAFRATAQTGGSFSGGLRLIRLKINSSIISTTNIFLLSRQINHPIKKQRTWRAVAR
jgi:hypothetical protein